MHRASGRRVACIIVACYVDAAVDSGIDTSPLTSMVD
jgi:hypothetical protein